MDTEVLVGFYVWSSRMAAQLLHQLISQPDTIGFLVNSDLFFSGSGRSAIGAPPAPLLRDQGRKREHQHDFEHRHRAHVKAAAVHKLFWHSPAAKVAQIGVSSLIKRTPPTQICCAAQ
jgi:hypothetical protein